MFSLLVARPMVATAKTPTVYSTYYQFQVVIKPSPDNIQELYLGSLKELGMDPTIHDIRFVEDDWENPTLGAWGLGWEVWAKRHGSDAVHLLPAGWWSGM